MYKILIINNETGAKWWEYGFKRYINKRANFILNDNTYELLGKYKLIFTWEILKKCLTCKVQFENN